MKIQAMVSAAIAMLLVTGCAAESQLAGSAAVVRGESIPTTLITSRVNEVRAEIETLPIGSVEQYPSLSMLSQMVLSRAILEKVVEEGLARKNIVLTDEQVQGFKQEIFSTYGQEQIEIQISTQNGVSKKQIDTFMRMVLGEQLLAQLLGPSSTSEEQTALLVDYLGQISREFEIQTAPRFGEWNPQTLQVAAGDMSLSQPAPLEITEQ